jgi:hypothetical protein
VNIPPPVEAGIEDEVGKHYGKNMQEKTLAGEAFYEMREECRKEVFHPVRYRKRKALP